MMPPKGKSTNTLQRAGEDERGRQPRGVGGRTSLGVQIKILNFNILGGFQKENCFLEGWGWGVHV